MPSPPSPVLMVEVVAVVAVQVEDVWEAEGLAVPVDQGVEQKMMGAQGQKRLHRVCVQIRTTRYP